ncbi:MULTISPECIES: amino acid ABC transporter ATP-binding protein [Paraburkholderia]|uniref:amino acid ABC transporter ATP-binding protein n=1 Tax=Paraburkholderia TaxID=1822464 RepID=UPI002258A423|nr:MULTISPECIES: amino acid ABC transporter ATP-binding protein [Paraburkholderia]MCX4161629.1 amino acid ABC transporter ATP-binding protein [Paraburkholderia megapolitana]MDN7157125.1 amino acid ABC transporter ATP-binding protein [Paraburkholderia sp. CHISQ3]MDQ6494170.1 amino acid ABC transporter ATP-binding protein [Paraburkholderia megapolitana]
MSRAALDVSNVLGVDGLIAREALGTARHNVHEFQAATAPIPDVAPSNALLLLRNVHLSYGETPVLNGIDLSVRRGHAVSIIGPSGSGKSTILRCINGLLTPQYGDIYVDGIDVRAQTTDAQKIALRKRIGFVFQQYNLFPHLNVLDNLTLAPTSVLGRSRAEAEHDAHELLAKVRLADKARAYPGALSGGQQQRVAIARALAMRPDLILFDEVTSALDPETVGEVLNVIGELADEGQTCVLVTHEMRFAEDVSDEVFFTEGGVILEHGPAREVFSDPANERTRLFLQRARGEDRHSVRRRAAG